MLLLPTGAAQGKTGTAVAQEKKVDGGAEEKKQKLIQDALELLVNPARDEKKNEKPISVPAKTDKKDRETYVHRAVYVRAQDAVLVLQKFYLERSQNPGQPVTDLRVSMDDRTNSILVNGAPDDIAQVKTVLAKIDVGTVPLGVGPVQLERVRAELKEREALLNAGELLLKAEKPALPEDTRRVLAMDLDTRKIMVAETRIKLELLTVLEIRMKRLAQLRHQTAKGGPLILDTEIEAASRAVEKARNQLERFEGF
jgi:hypothetical protein